MAAETGLVNYFLPIFSFLLVFIVIYALLHKTKILGENQPILLLVSLIMASFFIVNVNLVEYVEFTASWFVVIAILFFFAFLIIAFTSGKLEWFEKSWFAWVLLALLVGFFIVSSAFTFDWAVNWGSVYGWFFTDWFGFILLLIIAGVVSWVIAKKG